MAIVKHRIVTRRMLVVSVVVGVVLAALSVPMGAMLMGWPALSSGSSVRYAVHKGLLLRIERDGYRVGSMWSLRSTDGLSESDLAILVDTGEAVPLGEIGLPRQWRVEPASSDSAWLHDRVGWPARAAWTSSDAFADGANSPAVFPRWRGAVLVGSSVLPLRPIWLGLLVNTLFYTSLVLTPWAVARLWRTRRRRARGRCVTCGHELGDGVGVCPECGLGCS